MYLLDVIAQREREHPEFTLSVHFDDVAQAASDKCPRPTHDSNGQSAKVILGCDKRHMPHARDKGLLWASSKEMADKVIKSLGSDVAGILL